ncbi:MAG: hypothetical protein Q9222_001103 [Ikaeria aurantiellina]
MPAGSSSRSLSSERNVPSKSPKEPMYSHDTKETDSNELPLGSSPEMTSSSHQQTAAIHKWITQKQEKPVVSFAELDALLGLEPESSGHLSRSIQRRVLKNRADMLREVRNQAVVRRCLSAWITRRRAMALLTQYGAPEREESMGLAKGRDDGASKSQ